MVAVLGAVYLQLQEIYEVVTGLPSYSKTGFGTQRQPF